MGWPYKSPTRLLLVLEFEPSGWSLWVYWLHGFALYCFGGVVWYWFRFAALEAKARAGDVEPYNRALRGFPNALFAKMYGRRPLKEKRQFLR